MGRTQTAGTGPQAEAPPIDAVEARRVREERVRVGVEQARRVRLPQFLGDLGLAWLLLHMGAGQVLWAYLPWQVVAVHGRTWRLLRMTNQPQVDLEAVYRFLRWSPALVATGYVIPLLGAFQLPLQPLHYLLTMILCGAAAGSVAPAGGEVRGFIGFAAVLGIGNALCWLSWGGPQGWLPAVLVPVLLGLLAGYVYDQGKAQARQVRLTLRLEQANEARTRFFAAASHDLRQPLTALSYSVATIEALAQQRQDAALGEVAGNLRRSLRDSQALLSSLLEVSQLDAGAVEVRRHPVDLAQLLHSLAASQQAQAAASGLRLRTDIDPPLGPWLVQSDEALLRRVLQNLLGNALKFTREGEVALRLRRTPDEILLTVADTGPGIDPGLHERVFEEFFQVGNLARNRSQGLGLGLAIVRRLLQLLGLHLSLQSQPGVGSAFCVHLPRTDLEATAPLPAPGHEPRPARSLAGRAIRVLVVDDEAPIREALVGLLQTLAWSVRSAADRDSALAACTADWQPEAVVLDFRLQHGNSGLDVLQALRTRGYRGPAWLVTGDTSPQRIVQAQEAGIPVLYKPVDGLELAAQIRAALPA